MSKNKTETNAGFFLKKFFTNESKTSDAFRIEMKNKIKRIINSKKYKIFLFSDLEDLMRKTKDQHSLSLSLLFSYMENSKIIKETIKSTDKKIMNQFIYKLFPDTILTSRHELLLYFSLYSNDFSLIEIIIDNISDYMKYRVCEKIFCEGMLSSFNLHSFLSVDTLCNILKKYYIAESGHDLFSFLQFIIEDNFKSGLKIISSVKDNTSLYQYNLFRGIEDLTKFSSFKPEKLFQLVDVFYSNENETYTITDFNGGLHFFINENKKRTFTCSQMRLYQKYHILNLFLSFSDNYLFSFDQEKFPEFVELSENKKNIQRENIQFFFKFLLKENNYFEKIRNFLNLDELLLKFSLISGRKDFLNEIKKRSSYTISLQTTGKGAPDNFCDYNHNMKAINRNLYIIEKHIEIEKIVFLFYQKVNCEFYYFKSFSALDFYTDKIFDLKTFLNAFENLLLSKEYKNTDARETYIENYVLSNTINKILPLSKSIELKDIINLNGVLYDKIPYLKNDDYNSFMFCNSIIKESLCFLSEIYDTIRTEDINKQINVNIQKNIKKTRI